MQSQHRMQKWPFHGDNTGSNPVGDAKYATRNEQLPSDYKNRSPLYVTIGDPMPKPTRGRDGVYARKGMPGFWISYVDEFGKRKQRYGGPTVTWARDKRDVIRSSFARPSRPWRADSRSRLRTPSPRSRRAISSTSASSAGLGTSARKRCAARLTSLRRICFRSLARQSWPPSARRRSMRTSRAEPAKWRPEHIKETNVLKHFLGVACDVGNSSPNEPRQAECRKPRKDERDTWSRRNWRSFFWRARPGCVRSSGSPSPLGCAAVNSCGSAGRTSTSSATASCWK